MRDTGAVLLVAARWLAFGSAVTVLVSIAASQILLALSVAALLMSGAKMELPPVKLPLVLFMVGTVVSLLLSGEIAAGMPGVRKFFVFLELLVVYATMRDLVWIRRLFMCWGGAGALIALRGCVQFAAKVQQAQATGQDFYKFYVADRITGFMSHWMTFSGQEMFALMAVVALILYSPSGKKRTWVWCGCAGLMALALLLAETRNVWVATAVGMVYLLWGWKKWSVAVLPVAAVVVFLVSPGAIQERFESFAHPRGETDSNQHRIVTWRTGVNIIRRHPWFGVGPEGVKYHFKEYVPADIKKLPEGWYGHLHNIYLQFAAERGIPTMLMMMWLLAKVAWDFWSGLRRAGPGRSEVKFVLQVGLAVWLTTMVAGFFEHNLGDSEILAMFLVVVACGYRAAEQTGTGGEVAA